MAARLTGIPDWQFFTSTGAVLASGKVYFYAPGTTTEKDIYDDTDKATTLTNPVTLNSAGRVPNPVYAEGIYDIVIKDSDDATIDTISNWGDDWSAVGTDLSENVLSNHSFETAGTGGEPFENWTVTDSGSVVTRSTSGQHHGVAGALFTGSANSADSLLSDFFAVNSDRNLNIAFSIKANNASAQPSLQVKWYDSAQALQQTDTVYLDDVGLTPTSYTIKSGIIATPPLSTTRYAKINVIGNTSATPYNTEFDDIRIRPVSVIPEEAPYVPFGLEISRDAGDTSHDLNITAGAVKAAGGFTDDIVLPTEITKKIDAAFAEGDDAGGAESGFSIPTSGEFYVWLIKDSGTGHVDVLFSNSATSPTMPTGYDVKRRIGSWMADATNNLVDGLHKDLKFTFFSETEDVNDTTGSVQTFETATLSAPPNSYVHITGFVELTGNTDNDCILYVRTKGSTLAATEFYGWAGVEKVGANKIDQVEAQGDIMVNEDSQIEYAWEGVPGSGSIVRISVIGYDDLERNAP